mmetsp:Transcript_40833/g.57419  ORF Transcript_40833/g.57419 Transcript_40833/m.57419 type:complete len:223 (+) Transcript_40833:125-793(+)
MAICMMMLLMMTLYRTYLHLWWSVTVLLKFLFLMDVRLCVNVIDWSPLSSLLSTPQCIPQCILQCIPLSSTPFMLQLPRIQQGLQHAHQLRIQQGPQHAHLHLTLQKHQLTNLYFIRSTHLSTNQFTSQFTLLSTNRSSLQLVREAARRAEEKEEEEKEKEAKRVVKKGREVIVRSAHQSSHQQVLFLHSPQPVTVRAARGRILPTRVHIHHHIRHLARHPP